MNTHVFAYSISIIVVLALACYVGFARSYIRVHRLSVALARISDTFPAWHTCFEQSALITGALMLDEADLVVTAGTKTVHGLAPATPAPPPPTGSPQDLRHAMQNALAADLKGLSISALDGVLDAVEKQVSGSVLEFWRQAAEHWQQNPEQAVEMAVQIAKVAVDASAVNIEGLFHHFADLGALLHDHAASAPNLSPSGDLHHDLDAGAQANAFQTDTNGIGDVDLNIDDGVGGIFHGIDPTMLFDGIPVITIVRSSFREIRLLAANKTTALDSMKNLALDAGSTAVGITVGSLVGSVILPVPGLGAFIGGAVGGLASRMFGNHVKAIPCKEAIDAYQNAWAKYQLEFSDSIKAWFDIFDKASTDSRKCYTSAFSSFAPASQRPETNEITRRLMDALTADYSRSADQTRAASRSSALLPQDRWYHLLGGVSIEALVRTRAAALASERIDQMEKDVREMRMVQGNAARLRFVASLACSERDDIRAAFTATSKDIDALVKNVFSELQIWIGAARIAQIEAFKDTSDVFAKERERHSQVVSTWERELNEFAAEAKRKCEKLGG